MKMRCIRHRMICDVQGGAVSSSNIRSQIKVSELVDTFISQRVDSRSNGQNNYLGSIHTHFVHSISNTTVDHFDRLNALIFVPIV